MPSDRIPPIVLFSAAQKMPHLFRDAADFIVDGEPIWGGDRLWMLEHWLRHGSWDAVRE